MESTTHTRSTITLSDRENLQLKNNIFQHSTTSQFTHMSIWRCSLFCGVTAVHGHLERGLSFMSLSPQLKCTTTPHCAHIHCLVSRSIQQVSVNISGCNSFCVEEFSSTPLLCRHTYVRSILSDCPSAAICHRATKCNGILVGRFRLYCRATKISL